MIRPTDRVGDNVVNVEQFTLPCKLRLMIPALLAGVAITLARLCGLFFPVKATPVMRRTSAFPTRMLSTAQISDLPVGITFLRTKGRVLGAIISKFRLASPTFFSHRGTSTPTCLRAVLGALSVVGNLKSHGANDANLGNAVARRAHFPPSRITTRQRAKSSAIAIRLERDSTMLAGLFHKEIIPQTRIESEFVADIKRRLAHVEGADTPLFQGVAP